MNNGDGLRVVLWVSGCEHHCYYCQNPQTWDPNSGILFNEEAKQELFTELSKDYISGITFSGGDPLYSSNTSCITSLVLEISDKFPNKTIWLYTGYTWEECMSSTARRKIIEKCDVVVDGEYVEKQRDVTLHWRGSSNQRVIDVKKTFMKKKIVCID